MRVLSILLLFMISFQASASCRQDYEENITSRLTSVTRSNRVGKITTVSTLAVGTSFWSYMGVALVGPWGLLIGAQFGAIGALPIGTTFWVKNKIKKYGITKMANTLSVLIEVEENHPKVNTFSYDLLVKNLKRVYPNLSEAEFDKWINYLSENRLLCDGTVARFGRKVFGRKKMLADTNDILRYSNVKLKEFLF